MIIPMKTPRCSWIEKKLVLISTSLSTIFRRVYGMNRNNTFIKIYKAQENIYMRNIKETSSSSLKMKFPLSMLVASSTLSTFSP